MADHPLFEGFTVEDQPSVLGRERVRDDMSPGYGVSSRVRRWEQVELADVWVAPKVQGRVAPFNDFPGIDMVLPAFSRRACDALREFLEPNGELLPIVTDVGEYYFYNVTTILDALDAEQSTCKFWCDPPTTAVNIKYFVFDREKLVGRSIFRIHEPPSLTIVSDTFVRRVHENGLNGFDFRKIWPLPAGVNWRTFEPEGKQPAAGALLTRESLVIGVELSGSKPTAKERTRWAKLQDELDAQLSVATLEAPYFGKLVSSEVTDGEFRMFLSCPDARALVQKLRPWLEDIAGSCRAYALMRFGDMHDPDVLEELADLSNGA